MNKLKYILIALLFLNIAVPQPVLAQGPAKILEEPNVAGTSKDKPLITCGNGGTAATERACTANDFIKLIQNILNLVFAFGAFIATGMFMYAGFLYLTSVGNPAQIQKAHGVFKRVIIGFLIMFMSFLVVKQALTYLEASQFFINLIN